MPRVTYSATPLVWIEVRGEPMPGRGNRDDGGLIGQLLDFLHQANIFHARTGGMVGPGRMSFGFAPDDAPQITAWLKARRATEEDMDLVSSCAQATAALAAGGET